MALLAACNAISGISAFSVAADVGPSGLVDLSTPDADLSTPDADSSTPDATPKRSDDSPDGGGHEQDPDADVGVTLHVFVTSTRVNGSFGGAAGGDAICQRLAEAAGRSGDWRAWLSSSGNVAISRLESSGPWYLFDSGRLAVASRGELVSGSISAPIDVDENGTSGITDTVWTGTSATGASEADCASWSLPICIFPSCPGRSGRTEKADEGWTSDIHRECFGSAQRLYCFQNH